MKPTDIVKLMEELDEERMVNNWLIKGEHRPISQHQAPKRMNASDNAFLQTQDDSTRTFAFTYKAARFESGWLLDSLGYFYEQHWISDVLRKVKGGKEASVYLCRSDEQVSAPLVAAKVYRPRMLRNLKNDQLYRQERAVLDDEGRPVHDLGMLKAQHKRSVYGEAIRHQSWIAHEYTTLQALHAAGADVPQPYAMAHNAILMDYVGDESFPAPTLGEVRLGSTEAKTLFRRLLDNVKLMLSAGRIHADLSAYNVLYWQGGVWLIDFPQVISAHDHRQAYRIFERDLVRLCEYFISQGLVLQPRRLAAELWQDQGYPLSPEVDPRLLENTDPRSR